MQTRITARHYQLNNGIKEFAEERISSLTKFFENIIDAHIILDQERHNQIAELAVKVYGTHLRSKAKSSDMRASIDQAVEKMEQQLKKYKTRLKQKDPEKITRNKAFQMGSFREPEQF
jgi:putative sigma-54 modulation protein